MSKMPIIFYADQLKRMFKGTSNLTDVQRCHFIELYYAYAEEFGRVPQDAALEELKRSAAAPAS